MQSNYFLCCSHSDACCCRNKTLKCGVVWVAILDILALAAVVGTLDEYEDKIPGKEGLILNNDI